MQNAYYSHQLNNKVNLFLYIYYILPAFLPKQNKSFLQSLDIPVFFTPKKPQKQHTRRAFVPKSKYRAFRLTTINFPAHRHLKLAKWSYNSLTTSFDQLDPHKTSKIYPSPIPAHLPPDVLIVSLELFTKFRFFRFAVIELIAPPV